MMRNPTMIEVARRNAPSELVTHSAYEIPAGHKHALLSHLIKSRDMQQVLIFTRKKIDADRLARQMQSYGLLATAIHSDRSQGERTIALDDFKNGRAKILVATEVAARGLDLDQRRSSSPRAAAHTGRLCAPHRPHRPAGMTGEAISLVSPDEMEFWSTSKTAEAADPTTRRRRIRPREPESPAQYRARVGAWRQARRARPPAGTRAQCRTRATTRQDPRPR
jgi:ATP-dependent RNA helicase RhlE